MVVEPRGNPVSVKTGAALNADVDLAAAELAAALGTEQRINQQGAELQHKGAAIQGHEAEIQRLREQAQFMSTHQDRTFVGSDRMPNTPKKENCTAPIGLTVVKPDLYSKTLAPRTSINNSRLTL